MKTLFTLIIALTAGCLFGCNNPDDYTPNRFDTFTVVNYIETCPDCMIGRGERWTLCDSKGFNHEVYCSGGDGGHCSDLHKGMRVRMGYNLNSLDVTFQWDYTVSDGFGGVKAARVIFAAQK